MENPREKPLHRLLYWLCLAIFIPAPVFAQPANYHWGRGWTLPEQQLLLGGYFNFTYERLKDNPSRANLDDLSLFLTWRPHPRLRLFSELELEDVFTIEQGAIHAKRSFFSVERLYLDYFINPTWRWRLGKFLTPVGRWNVIHAAPLVWTTSRPLVTENIFANHTTGSMLSATFNLAGRDLDLSVYFDASEVLDPKKTPVTFKNAGGLRLQYEASSNWQVGMSYLHFKMERPNFQPDADLFGLDFHWEWHRFEVTGELAYRRPNGGSDDEKGLYLQGVVPLFHRLYAIGRYEYLQGTHFLESGVHQGTTHLQIAALAWRPAAPLVFKLEYRFGQNNRRIASDGFLASVAMLF